MKTFEEDKEKSFNPTKGRQGERGRDFSSSQEDEREDLIFDQPLAAGQEWQTKNANRILIIENQNGDQFGVIVKRKKDGLQRRFLVDKQELQEVLAKSKYSLVVEVQSDLANAQVSVSDENSQLIRGGVDVGAGQESSADKVDDGKDKQGQDLSSNEISKDPVDLQGTIDERIDLISKQITSMKRKLGARNGVLKRLSDLAKIEEYKKLIEELKLNIEEAEEQKTELLREKEAEAQRLAEEKKGLVRETREKELEEKIGKEKYEALKKFADSFWEKFMAKIKEENKRTVNEINPAIEKENEEIRKKNETIEKKEDKIKEKPKRNLVTEEIWGRVLEIEALPQIKKEIERFLQKCTTLNSSEYEAVYNSLGLVEKIIPNVSSKA